MAMLYLLLKQKLKGRNKDYHVSDINNYQSMKDELNKNQERLEHVDKKSKVLGENTKDMQNTIYKLKPTMINKDNYIISSEDKEKLTKYLDEVEYTNDSFKEMNKLLVLIDTVNLEMYADKNEIKILTENK